MGLLLPATRPERSIEGCHPIGFGSFAIPDDFLKDAGDGRGGLPGRPPLPCRSLLREGRGLLQLGQELLGADDRVQQAYTLYTELPVVAGSPVGVAGSSRYSMM